MAQTEAQKRAEKTFRAKHYRVPVTFPGGTKERIEALSGGKSPSAFCRDVILAKLDELERILGTGKTE